MFDDMAELVDGTHATGKFAYRGGELETQATFDATSTGDESSTEILTQVTRDSFTQGIEGSTQSASIQESAQDKGKQRADIEADNENIDPVSLFIYPCSVPNKQSQTLDMDPDVRPENLKRQRSKSSASTGNDRRKVRRVSTGQGMVQIGGSMEKALREVKETMLESTSRIGPSTQQGQHHQPLNVGNMAFIVSAIENNDDFSDNEKVDAYKIIKNDARVGDIFAAMTRRDLQTKFLRDEIIEFRVNKYGVGYEEG